MFLSSPRLFFIIFYQPVEEQQEVLPPEVWRRLCNAALQSMRY